MQLYALHSCMSPSLPPMIFVLFVSYQFHTPQSKPKQARLKTDMRRRFQTRTAVNKKTSSPSLALAPSPLSPFRELVWRSLVDSAASTGAAAVRGIPIGAAVAAGRALEDVVADPLGGHDVGAVVGPHAVAADRQLLATAIAFTSVVVTGPFLQAQLLLLLQQGHEFVTVSSLGQSVGLHRLRDAGTGCRGEEDKTQGCGEAHFSDLCTVSPVSVLAFACGKVGKGCFGGS